VYDDRSRFRLNGLNDAALWYVATLLRSLFRAKSSAILLLSKRHKFSSSQAPCGAAFRRILPGARSAHEWRRQAGLVWQTALNHRDRLVTILHTIAIAAFSCSTLNSAGQVSREVVRELCAAAFLWPLLLV
jgi:hypothetical protein